MYVFSMKLLLLVLEMSDNLEGVFFVLLNCALTKTTFRQTNKNILIAISYPRFCKDLGRHTSIYSAPRKWLTGVLNRHSRVSALVSRDSWRMQVNK